MTSHKDWECYTNKTAHDREARVQYIAVAVPFEVKAIEAAASGNGNVVFVKPDNRAIKNEEVPHFS